ncbi:deubiquitinating protein VCPIP1-like [Amphibalanus amphitrite]|uniref:deubiquitinating protein VCPIP1-like n=1 Tax=Amphibalanus amphitrite TaxID=1232801 RepID=UPI001C916D70|nr:deubiquitinating protein VCPIP1-like [Amphibalanus amphitrite]
MSAFMRGACPDAGCARVLFFPAHERSVECSGCGQRHACSALESAAPVEDIRAAALLTYRRLAARGAGAARGPENVKVLGSSNYHCKLVSPLLSSHGLEKSSGRARPLRELTGQAEFQCSVLAPYAFRLSEEHLETPGYGRDTSGSAAYLRHTLQAVAEANDGEERLVPIHADGDGHCLVHALSRALTGRELFWHPLRMNLQQHFTDNMGQYRELFREFISAEDWPLIVDECDPDYVPPDGQPHGLRNIHVFGLANVLRRPIVLLDSFTGLRSSGDYAALFLPALVPPDQCRSGASRQLNSPLCLAWSSAGRNHYIALVPVKDRKLPRLPVSLLPKVWGVDQSLRDRYLTITDGCCTIGSDKSLQDGYIQRLTAAMDELFVRNNGVHPELVADAHLHLFKRVGVQGFSPPHVCDEVRLALAEDRLYRCLRCDAVLEQRLEPGWLRRGGYLHRLATEQHGQLSSTRLYRFPLQGILCGYDEEEDRLVLKEDQGITSCPWCHGTVRPVEPTGVPRYKNGDPTRTAAADGARCHCGQKHWWDGVEYDSPPLVFPVTLRWGSRVIGEKVAWFEGESDPALNSNVYQTANQIIVKHFPGVFGIETLVKQVVDQILEQTKSLERPTSCQAAGAAGAGAQAQDGGAKEEDGSSKIILTGMKTLHKEELGVSETERRLKERIERNAPVQQQRKRQPSQELRPAAVPPPRRVEGSPRSSPGPPAAPASPAAAPSPPPAPAGRRVRVVASSGQQADLTLPPEATYGAFLTDVEAALAVERSRIRRVLHGFPPRQVTLAEEELAPFQSGERIQVELAADPSAAPPPPPAASAPAAATAASSAGRPVLPSVPASELDAGIQALVLAAQLSGTELWQQVQAMPVLFAKGGLFYRLAERDVGLTDGKHISLQALPGKMFIYDAASDRLLLCLEPLGGHHPVTAGVERRVLGAAAAPAAAPAPAPTAAGAARIGQLLSSGTRRVTPGRLMNRPVPPTASFTGQGHTLGGSAPAPAPAAVPATSSGAGGTREEGATFVRVGPGSVVLRPAEGEPRPVPPSAPAPAPSPESAPDPAPAPEAAGDGAGDCDGGEMDMS